MVYSGSCCLSCCSLPLARTMFSLTWCRFYISVTVFLLASVRVSRGAPAAEVQVPFTSGPCTGASEGTLRWNHDRQSLEVCNGNEWVGVTGYMTSRQYPAPSCKQLRQQRGIRQNGVYWIQPQGAYCDMETDGGGWMLLYAYKHTGGEKFDLVTAMPTSPDGYSHQLLNSLGISTGRAQELRFYCKTSSHNRVVHFKTSNRNIIQTAYDGKKHFAPSDWQTRNTKLSGHTAYIPDAVNSVWATSQSTPGFTDFPFYRAGAYHWGIAPRYGSGRFECDDGAGNYNYDTIHRVFIRD